MVVEKKKEEPVWKCRYGRVTCAVFAKQVQKGEDIFTVHNCVITRNYKDSEGVWHNSSGFEARDLHDLIFCATKAYDEIRSKNI